VLGWDNHDVSLTRMRLWGNNYSVKRKQRDLGRGKTQNPVPRPGSLFDIAMQCPKNRFFALLFFDSDFIFRVALQFRFDNPLS
jgi:hypothetical protein